MLRPEQIDLAGERAQLITPSRIEATFPEQIKEPVFGILSRSRAT